MNGKNNIPVVLSIPQCAEAYGLPVYALRRWVKTGELKAVHSGRKVFINTNLLEEFLSGETTKAAAAPREYGVIRRVYG